MVFTQPVPTLYVFGSRGWLRASQPFSVRMHGDAGSSNTRMLDFHALPSHQHTHTRAFPQRLQVVKHPPFPCAGTDRAVLSGTRAAWSHLAGDQSCDCSEAEASAAAAAARVWSVNASQQFGLNPRSGGQRVDPDSCPRERRSTAVTLAGSPPHSSTTHPLLSALPTTQRGSRPPTAPWERSRHSTCLTLAGSLFQG